MKKKFFRFSKVFLTPLLCFMLIFSSMPLSSYASVHDTSSVSSFIDAIRYDGNLADDFLRGVDAGTDVFVRLIDATSRGVGGIIESAGRAVGSVLQPLCQPLVYYTSESSSGSSHGGGGASRIINETPTSAPQSIVNNDQIYNFYNNEYETINNIYNYTTNNYNNYVFETNEYYITYEFNYTYYNICYAPLSSPSDTEYFQVYYQLPDGRSSFNLTVNDIDGVVFNYDMINYDATPQNSYMRGLWHLDGTFYNSVLGKTGFCDYGGSFVDGMFGGCFQFYSEYDGKYNLPDGLSLYCGFYPDESTAWSIEFRLYVPTPTVYSYVADGDWYYHNYAIEGTRAVTRSLAIYDCGLVPDCWYTVCIDSDGYIFIDGEEYIVSDYYENGVKIQVDKFAKWLDECFCFENGNITFQNHLWEDYYSANYEDYDCMMLSDYAVDEIVLYGGSDSLHRSHESSRGYASYYIYDVRNEPYDFPFAYTVPDIPSVVSFSWESYGNPVLNYTGNDFVLTKEDILNHENTVYCFRVDIPVNYLNFENNTFSANDHGSLYYYLEYIDSSATWHGYTYTLSSREFNSLFSHLPPDERENASDYIVDGYLPVYYATSFRVYGDEIERRYRLSLNEINTENYLSRSGYLNYFDLDKFVKISFYFGDNLNVYSLVPEEVPFSKLIAVQSTVAVNHWQIGGVRNASPSVGDVYISLEDSRASSCQQYFNGVWNEVCAGVYIKGRWYDVLAFDFSRMMLVDDGAENSSSGVTNYYVYNIESEASEEVVGLLQSILDKLDNIGNRFSLFYNNWLNGNTIGGGSGSGSSGGGSSLPPLDPEAPIPDGEEADFCLLDIVIIFFYVVYFALILFNILRLFVLMFSYLVHIIAIPASEVIFMIENNVDGSGNNLGSYIHDVFVVLKGGTAFGLEEPIYAINVGNVQVTLFAFMVVLFEIALVGGCFVFMRRYVMRLEVPKYKE